MIVVHHLNNSRSQRILWLLEELGLPYELKFYERDPKTMLAPASLKAVHPLGKSPVITDGDNTIAESGAILEYIIERAGGEKLRPKSNTPERLKYTYWMHYAEGSAMLPLLLTLIFSRIPKQPMPFFIKPIAKAICEGVLFSYVSPQLKLNFDFIESELQKSDWFAGEEFSAADIIMSFPIEAANARGAVTPKHTALKGYLLKIHQRQAYQRALLKGGPYDLLS